MFSPNVIQTNIWFTIIGFILIPDTEGKLDESKVDEIIIKLSKNAKDVVAKTINQNINLNKRKIKISIASEGNSVASR